LEAQSIIFTAKHHLGKFEIQRLHFGWWDRLGLIKTYFGGLISILLE